MGRRQQYTCDAACQVFVGGTMLVDTDELRDHFESYGNVLSVRVAYDRAGRRRGFSFIQFEHATSAQQASLVGLQHEVAGQLVTVQPMRQNSKSTHTRQTQVQHCGPISENVSVSLLDVLHQVPTLPELLTQGSQLALSATCKSFRLQFFAQVQVVTVLREEDYALVPQRKWPRLNLVILQDAYSYCSVSLPENIRIVKIHISDADGRAIVSMLRPLHNPASDLPSTRLAAQQLAHQMRLRWPLMGSFTMSDVHNLDGLGNKIVSQLVTGRWTHLVRLLLSDCDLQAEEFLLLGQGNWPGLMWLDVSGSSLDAKGMAWLAKGNWPRLFSIKLSVNPTLGARAIAQLGAANWLKEELVITDTPFSTDMAAALADLQLPKLRELRLKGSGLTAAAVSELARADWPNLRDLSMHHDDLDAVAVVLGKVDELKSNTSFDAQYCAFTVSEQRMLSWPDMGLWPNLSQIRVSKRSVHLWL